MSFPMAHDIAAQFTAPNGERLLRDLLHRQPVLRGNAEAIEAIIRVATIKSYNPKEFIITQGATDTDFYFILSGSVIVSPNRREDTLRSAGTHVGEMAAIDPAALRSATVTAYEPTVLASVAEPDFSAIADAHPFIWRYLAGELAGRLRERVTKVLPRAAIPRLFIASSSEALKLAETLREELKGDPFDVQIWSEGNLHRWHDQYRSVRGSAASG